MKRTFYILNSGTLARKENTLVVEFQEGEERRRRYLPVEQVYDLHVLGEVTLNKRLLEFLARHGIPLHFYNRHGYYAGTYYPREHNVSGHVLLQQVSCYLDEARRVDLARRFVQGALANILRVLGYYATRGKPLQEAREAVESHLNRLPHLTTVDQMMQAEGQAREAYYRAFDTILDNPDFAFGFRSRRPPANRINALISFGNSLLYTTVLSEIYHTHLDPRVGFLHATNFRRFSLNLDVAEVFKPLLVDRTIFALVQRREIRPEHFESSLEGVYLKEEGRQRFVRAWEERLQTTFHHRALKRHVSYRRLIRLELYKVERHLIGDGEYTPFVHRW